MNQASPQKIIFMAKKYVGRRIFREKFQTKRHSKCPAGNIGSCPNDCPNFKLCSFALEKIVGRAQSGERIAIEGLIKLFEPYVYRMEKRYFIPGQEKEDLFQEGFIGLFIGIMSYKAWEKLSLKDYVSLSIQNSIVRAVRSATQKKQLILTHAHSVHEKLYSNLKGKARTPESSAINMITLEKIFVIINSKLSFNEAQILKMKIYGYTSVEIANFFGREKKAVDNSLYRSRQKIRKLIAGGLVKIKKKTINKTRKYLSGLFAPYSLNKKIGVFQGNCELLKI
ncbi:MAG: sigma-70 family RNA polymerase sigma factor [Candidatus Eremiobacteraeota bacterium]|nr:sigma-70 family RNA polymerase sigma factor [Candidatus Eremiobacteraeota bacterium]